MRSSRSSGLSVKGRGRQGGGWRRWRELAGTALSQSWAPWDPDLLLALIMHFEDERDGNRATSEGLLPCRTFSPTSTEGAVATSSGSVGERGVRACPPPPVFLAFRVTLQSHSAKSVCCSFSSARAVLGSLCQP